MKKILTLILVITILAASFVGFGTVALAADVEMNVTSNVSELIEAGEVEFTVTITNNSGSTIYPEGIVYACNGQQFNEMYDAPILTGEQAQIVFTRVVNEDMLDHEISFALVSDYTGTAPTDSLTISKKIPTIVLAASGKANKTLTAKGEIVTFTFSLENQGEAQIDDIVVSAPELNDGDPLRDAFTLVSTQGYSVVYKHTMDKEIIVNPVVTYTAGGVAQEPIVLEPIELKEEQRNVTPNLTVDNKNPNAGEDVTFTLNIENSGNVPYTNMKVYMNGEEVDFPANNLNPGNSYSEEYVTSFEVSTDVVFKVTLKDHHGQTVSVNSNTIAILLPVDSAALTDKLTFNMSVDRPKLTSEATINFTGNITNASEYVLSEISVDEDIVGNVYSADELSASTSKKLEFNANINETTTYNFVLTVKDRNGKVYTVSADPITVEITSAAIEDDQGDFDDAADVDEPGQELTLKDDEKGVGKLGTLGIISIVLIVLIIGVGVTLIVLWKKGASPSRRPQRKTSSKSPAKKKTVKRPTRNYKDRNNF